MSKEAPEEAVPFSDLCGEPGNDVLQCKSSRLNIRSMGGAIYLRPARKN